MSDNEFVLTTIKREQNQQGKGASRRLRKENLIPAIIYGGNEEPTSISLRKNELVKALENEAFFSHVLTLEFDGSEDEQVVIKDLQRHPAKGYPMHADFMRIVKGQKISMNVPVHFDGRAASVGIKAGGILDTLVSDIEISCLPSKLPEYISVDISDMQIGDTLHFSDIKLPEDVTINELEAGTDRTIANMQAPKAEKVEETAESDDAGEGEE